MLKIIGHCDTGSHPYATAHGHPVRRKAGFPFGIAREEPLVPAGDEWWQPMTDAEAEDWIEGR
jgi:hypothetical protein